MARERLDVQGALGKKGVGCSTLGIDRNEPVEQEETIIQMAGGHGPDRGPGGGRGGPQGKAEALARAGTGTGHSGMWKQRR